MTDQPPHTPPRDRPTVARRGNGSDSDIASIKGPLGTSAEQRQAAVLAVATRYRDDPHTAREVLEMLGLLDPL